MRIKLFNNKSFIKRLFNIQKLGLTHKRVNILGFKIKYRCDIEDQKYYHYLPIQNNKIVFRHHVGSYACNAKYITEEILKQNLPYELVWVVNKHILKFQKDFPPSVRLVMTDTPEAYKEYASSKIWVDSERRNTFISKGLFKREGQVYIQTWHGSLGIKKTAPDRKDISNRGVLKISQKDASQIDYLTSNGKYTSNFFRRIFWNNGRILEIGHPRNDIFFMNSEKIRQKVYKELKICAKKKQSYMLLP